MASVRQKKLREHAQSLHAEQTNVLAVFERNREIVELPEGLANGHVQRRRRGARTDEDCIHEICELVARGITASAATEFINLPWSTWNAWLRRNHCQAREKYDLAYDFHLEAMADKTQRIFVELKAERKRCMDDYHKRYDDWLDECKKLTKEDWKPPEPQYRGPAEWELKIAEDQVKSWQWHLEMRHDKFKRKIETDNKNATTRCTVHEIDIKNTDTPEEALRKYHRLIEGKV